MRLFDILFPPRSDETALRAVSADAFLALMRPRLTPETRPGTAALLPFNVPSVRAAIHEAKYHGHARAFDLLALALADYLRDLDDGNYGHQESLIIVPVPLGKKRRKERGFNQVEEVARFALRSLGEEGARVSLEPSILERVRETESQVALPRGRREENMRGAFSVNPSKLEERRRAGMSRTTFILIDDVITTGATLQAAIDALCEAGVAADNILPVALAH